MTAVVLAVAAAVYLLLALIVLPRRKPGYSHIRHTISELGETGAPDARLVALGVFLPIGMLTLIAAAQLRASLPPAAALALCVAAGYLGAAVFPCDPGSPVSGTGRQALHNLAGGVEYVGGGFALIALAEHFGAAFQTAGVVVLGAAAVLTVLPSLPVRGLVQRAAEICLFGGLATAAFRA